MLCRTNRLLLTLLWHDMASCVLMTDVPLRNYLHGTLRDQSVELVVTVRQCSQQMNVTVVYSCPC